MRFDDYAPDFTSVPPNLAQPGRSEEALVARAFRSITLLLLGAWLQARGFGEQPRIALSHP